MRSDGTRLVFHLPEGRLSFADGDLDLWAEHLAWCYGLLGVQQGCTIAVQDFGSSPLSFLGSALLMPTLGAGIAERLHARFICLDASSERIALTPALLAQLAVDVLVVRGDIVNLLAPTARRMGIEIDDGSRRVIVATDGTEPLPHRSNAWRYLVHAESSLFFAPQCTNCDAFHLRDGFYRLDGEVVVNLRWPTAPPHLLAACTSVARDTCAAGPTDRRVHLQFEP